MNIASQQTGLLALLKSGHTDGADPYIQTVAQSDHLTMLREIILTWRFFDIERHCRLTASLLKKRGIFEEAVKSFSATPNLSPFPDQLAQAFFDQMGHHRDPLVACVAQFECSLVKVKQGDNGQYTVDWPVDPQALIPNLLGDTPLELPPEGHYQTKISRDIPGLVRITTSRTTSVPRKGDD